MTSTAPDTALADVRVLDLTGPAGAYCTKLLADLGADVIRIEPPGGDPARHVAPFVRNMPDADASIPFLFLNSNKRSITLNLETEDGRGLFRRLVERAGIVVESHAPGYLDGLGLGYADLSALNPGIIVTSITAFGQNGPYRDFKATDLIAVAMGGLLRLCGFPGRAPDRPGGDQAYTLAGLHGSNGTLLALYHRDLTGAGQHVDVSMQQAVFTATGYIVHWAEIRGVDMGRGGHRYNDLPGTFRMIFPCMDGWIVGGPGLRAREWETVRDWMQEWGHAADLGDEAWGNAEYRRAHWHHVEDVWENFLMRYPREVLYAAGQERRLTLMPVYSMEDVANDPQLAARDFFQWVEHPTFGPLQYPGPAFRPSLTPVRPPAPAPHVGEHNQEIFEGELGLSRVESDALRRAGVM